MKSTQEKIRAIAAVLEKETAVFIPPLIDLVIKKYGKDPYLILIATLLSLRAKDRTTWPVVQVLFDTVQTPQTLLQLSGHELERIIFKTGFYQQKAATLRAVSHALLQRFDGHVPQSQEELLSIKGIGLKTANLVLGAAFDVPAICVDVHVHRISNRLGLIKTESVEETEQELMKLLPKELWINWNRWLVIWGQNICSPRKPLCARCPLQTLCEQKI